MWESFFVYFDAVAFLKTKIYASLTDVFFKIIISISEDFRETHSLSLDTSCGKSHTEEVT